MVTKFYNHYNQHWFVDCIIGPRIKNKKTFLIIAFDYYSKIVVGSAWFYKINLNALEIILKKAIRCFGLPRSLYCEQSITLPFDFIMLICKRLNINCFFTTLFDNFHFAKKDRFFEKVHDKFLSVINIDEIENVQHLNKKFKTWLEQEYHSHIYAMNGAKSMKQFIENIPVTKISMEKLNTAFKIAKKGEQK